MPGKKKNPYTWSANELKAILEYSKRNKLRLSLSNRPIVCFYDKDMNLIKVEINLIMTEYNISKEEERRETIRKKNEMEREAAAQKRKWG